MVGVVLGRMEKNQEENMRENSWEEYLVRRGGRRENWWGSGGSKNKSPQIEEKAEKKIVLFVQT